MGDLATSEDQIKGRAESGKAAEAAPAPAVRTSPSLLSVAQIGAPVMALVYVIGFIIVQVDLAGYGYPGLGEFRIRYLTTGIVFLILTVGPLLIGAALGECGRVLIWGHERLRLGRNVRLTATERWRLMGVPLLYLVYPLGSVVWAIQGLRVPDQTRLGVAPSYCFVLAAVGLCVSGLWRWGERAVWARGGLLGPGPRDPDVDKVVRAGLTVAVAALGCMGLFLAMFGYARWVHPRLPAGLGGGLGTPAVIRLDQEGAPFAAHTVFPVSGEAKPAPAGLPQIVIGLVLDETATGYMVLIPQPLSALSAFGSKGHTTLPGRVSDIPRARVVGITYLPWSEEADWPPCASIGTRPKDCRCGGETGDRGAREGGAGGKK